MQHSSPLRSYCAHLVPRGTDLDQVERLAAAKALTPLRLLAANAEKAEQAAHQVTGLPVYSVERIEPLAA